MKILVKIILFLLRNKNLSKEERGLLITGLLDRLNALTLRDNITTADGRLEINGRPVDVEQAIRLRESAQRILDNEAEKIVEDHVLYTSIVLGVHKGDNPDSMIFSRAAIWWHQQRRQLLESLAHGDPDALRD